MIEAEVINDIKLIENPHINNGVMPAFLSKRETEPARHIQMSLDDYTPTPLTELSSLASHCGVKSILVKDESQRFGPKAFKGLGGSFAASSVRPIAEISGLM